MRLRPHYIRSPRRRRLDGPLRSLVLMHVPPDYLVTADRVVEATVLYLDNHPGERAETLRHIPFERVRPACEQLLAELVLDGFVVELCGQELTRFICGR